MFRGYLYKNEAILFNSSLLIRLTLILIFPMVWGGDSINRLFMRDQILIYHFLPGTQLLVYVVFALTKSWILVRIAFAFCASLLSVFMYKYLTCFQEKKKAFLNALIFSIIPLNVALSIVPYQEMLFLLTLFIFLYFLDKNKWYLALFAFGMACLVRYEMWLFFPFLIYLIVKRRREQQQKKGIICLLSKIVLASWGIILWLIINQVHFGHYLSFLVGYVSTANQTGEINFEYLICPYIWIVKFGSPIMIFAALGIFTQNFRKYINQTSFKLCLIWAALLLIILPLIIPGYSGSHRFAILSICLLSALVTSGIDLAFIKTKIYSWVYPIAVFSVFIYMIFYIHHISNEQDVKTHFTISQKLDPLLKLDNKLIIFADESETLAYRRISVYTNCGTNCLFFSPNMGFTSVDDIERMLNEEGIRFILSFRKDNPGMPDNQLLQEYLKIKNLDVVEDYGMAILYTVK